MFPTSDDFDVLVACGADDEAIRALMATDSPLDACSTFVREATAERARVAERQRARALGPDAIAAGLSGGI